MRKAEKYLCLCVCVCVCIHMGVGVHHKTSKFEECFSTGSCACEVVCMRNAEKYLCFFSCVCIHMCVGVHHNLVYKTSKFEECFFQQIIMCLRSGVYEEG
jgi:hypothetical protein